MRYSTPYTARLSFFLFLTLAAVLTISLSSNASLRGHTEVNYQDGDAVLEKADDFSPPVEITLTKSHIGVIKPGKRFSAGEDWFKGLTVRVRNNSDRPITHLSLRLRFPRPKGQEGELDFVEPLVYGESPIPDAAGIVPANTARPVMPGESVELRLSDEDFYEVREQLTASKYLPSIKKIRLSVQIIGFDDGTVWVGGKRYVPDKDSPGKLIPLEKKVAVVPASHYSPDLLQQVSPSTARR